MDDANSVKVQMLEKFVEAFNRHDIEAVMAFFADDCRMYMPRGPEPWGQRLVGKAAVREGVARRFEGLPDAHYGNDSHWVCGSLGVSRWTLTGTMLSGTHLEVQGVDLLEFQAGKIVSKDSYWKIVE